MGPERLRERRAGRAARAAALVGMSLSLACQHPEPAPQVPPDRRPLTPVLITQPRRTVAGGLALASVFPAVGRYAASGLQSERGAALAVEEVNARGGVRGRRLELLGYRTGSYFVDARFAAERAASEGALAIVGSNSSSLSQAVAEVAEARQLPQITNISTAASLTWNPQTGEDRRFVFRMCAADDVLAEHLAEFAWEDLKARRVAVLYEISRAYSSGLAQGFVEAFTRRAGAGAVREFMYLPLETDFRANLRRVKAFAPDVLLVPGSFTDASLVAAQAEALGLRATLLGGDGWSNPLLFWSGGPSRPAYHAELCVVPPSFRQRFLDRFGEDHADCRALLAHDAVAAVAAALNTMGPLTDQDLAAGLPRTRLRLRDALARVRVRGEDGLIRFDAHGDAVRDVAIVKVTPGASGYQMANLGWLGG